MSVSSAIGLVSSSLRNLLAGEMTLTPRVPVTILAPDETGGDQRLNLFLYKVEENEFLRNQDWTLKRGSSDILVPPPLSLNLYYLLTPYARNDPDSGNTTAHAILGEAMRVFYEHSVLPETYLEDELKNSREQFRIISNAMDPEELSRLWSTFGEPFRLSVRYQVSTVQLDMLVRQKMIGPRVRSVGPPTVGGAMKPPAVLDIAPSSGPPGTTITFGGENLAGCRATVTSDTFTLLQAQDLESNQFRVTMPADAMPGLYELAVDISQRFRRTFLFEVTS